MKENKIMLCRGYSARDHIHFIVAMTSVPLTLLIPYNFITTFCSYTAFLPSKKAIGQSKIMLGRQIIEAKTILSNNKSMV
jgi:hypothetical protein